MSSRRRCASRSRDDAGVGMVMVIGLMMVVAVISVTLVSVTVFGTRYTSQSRIGVRTQAAADAGIDVILAQLEGKTYNQLSTVCSQAISIDSIPVTVTTQYTVVSGASTVTTACPAPGDAVTSLRVTARAVTVNSVNQNQEVVRRTAAIIAPTPPEVMLDKAVFGEADLVLTNDFQLIASGALDAAGHPISDANVYSNGSVTCKTQVNAGGSIYAAQGDLTLENNCDIGNSVWASGNVHISSNASVDGDVYAAAATIPYSVMLDNNTSLVTGNVLTNGGIKMNDAKVTAHGGIHGSAFSRLGMIDLQNGSGIGGSAYANLDIAFNNGSIVGADALSLTGSLTTTNNGNSVLGTATAKGTISPTLAAATKAISSTSSFPAVPNPAVVFRPSVGYPTQIQPPAREQLAQVQMTSTQIDQWVAAGWRLETIVNQCSSAKAALDAIADWSSPVLAVFTGCTSPVTFESAQFTGTTALRNNLAIVSDTGFTSNNELQVSSSDATNRKLYWIVPANAPGITWAGAAAGQTTPVCSPSRDIVINKAEVHRIEWMLYTPCTLTWTNGMPGTSDAFLGQMYAGRVNIATKITLKMSSVPIPSLAVAHPSPTEPAKMNLSSRYDLPAN